MNTSRRDFMFATAAFSAMGGGNLFAAARARRLNILYIMKVFVEPRTRFWIAEEHLVVRIWLKPGGKRHACRGKAVCECYRRRGDTPLTRR